MNGLFKEILIKLLEKEQIQVTFPNQQLNIAELIEMKCYSALQKIKEIITNDLLSDEDCFTKIEEIICVFEEMGSNGGFRHDFG